MEQRQRGRNDQGRDQYHAVPAQSVARRSKSTSLSHSFDTSGAPSEYGETVTAHDGVMFDPSNCPCANASTGRRRR